MAVMTDSPCLCVGFQNSATSADLGFNAARSYSQIRPPRTPGAGSVSGKCRRRLVRPELAGLPSVAPCGVPLEY
jgi:hypothetical protein